MPPTPSCSHEHDAPTVPRAALIGAASLIAFAVVAAGSARIWHWHAATPMPVTALQSVRVRFLDRPDGGVEIRDADHSNDVLRQIPPGTNGFLRGVMRGLARTRRAEHVAPEIPFTLTRWADGEMTLTDTGTGQRLSLEVFGMDNARVFASLLTDVPTNPAQGSSP